MPQAKNYFAAPAVAAAAVAPAVVAAFAVAARLPAGAGIPSTRSGVRL